MTGVVQVETTVDTEAAAASLAQALVGERLAACVQVLGPVASTYRWRGAIERSTEWLCLAKTTEAASSRVMARIRELHTYQQPEILVLPVSEGEPAYLAWVRAEVQP